MVRHFHFTLGVALVGLLLSGCFFSGGSAASDIKIRAAVFSSQLNDQGQPLTVAHVFPSNVSRISAIVLFEGVKSGNEIVGLWYQLGGNAPPEGRQVHKSSIKLSDNNVKDGRAQVTLILPAVPLAGDAGPQATPLAHGIPEDSWLLRISADGKLLRTLGFVVVANAPPPLPVSPGASATPAPASSPASGVGTPLLPTGTPNFQTYTIVAGDTLQTIANRFKPANEAVDAFVARIVRENNLSSPTVTLSVGQQLRIPR